MESRQKRTAERTEKSKSRKVGKHQTSSTGKNEHLMQLRAVAANLLKARPILILLLGLSAGIIIILGLQLRFSRRTFPEC